FHIPARVNRSQSTYRGRRESAPLAVPANTTDGIGFELSAQREADRILISQFSPPGVLVNGDLQVIQFRGSTSEYLEPPVGKASFNLLKMAKEGLMLPLRAAMEESKKENKTTRRENVRMNHNGESRAVNLEVIPLKNLPFACYLVLFEHSKSGGQALLTEQPPERSFSERKESSRINELESELSDSRQYIRALQEQHESTTEELQAASDEVQSANEELQSINEELETSKEELESANEELTTINDEMSYRNSELNVLNNDLVNFQNSAKLIILLLGRDLTVRRFSPQAEKHFKLIDTDIGRPISHVRHNLVHTDDVKTPLDLEALCIEVINTESELDREVLDKAGCWYSLRARPYITLDKNVDGAVLLMMEINELKQSEQSVAAARDYAENMVETVRAPLLVLNSDLCVESANRSFYRAFRVEPSETIGTFIYDLGNHQWNIPRLRELLEEILPHSTSIEAFQVEHDFEKLGRRIMLLDARRILDPQKKTKQILLAIEDITDRKELEQKLNASETLYRRQFETAKDGILILDAENGEILEANPFMTDLSGYPVEEFIGKELWEIGLFRDQAANESAFKELQQKGFVRYNHLPLKSAYEQQVEVEFVSNVYEWDHRRVAQCNIRDISVRSRLEQQSQKQAAELSDLHRRKDEFLAMLSHELRSPLAPIANAVGLLSLQKGSENLIQQQARNIIERQMKHMQRLVDDLLEVSRITTGRVQLRRERVVVSRIVEGAVETARPLIEERRHQLTVSIPPEPIWLNADVSRMEQVLVNLLTNAAKYTKDGGRIWVTVQQEGELCVVRVRDNGVGISQELLPRIFDLFTQAERSLDRSQGGLGIGLALVQRLTNLHSGTVEAESQLGQGSEFIVRLPMLTDGHPTKQPTAEPAQLPGRSLRVLVVDDNVDTVLSFSMLLRASGHDVYTAHDGMEAVKAALKYKPDVVLLDIGLPVLNGYEVARRIRLELTLEHVVLIALTGYGQEADRQTALQAGFDHHLVKPARLEQLQKILSTVAIRST
ncbi:MAG TPA: ATP-binding protein, partial [Pirellula sp.]|nr:ATP-binding protein [Pirellula sp.]